MKGEKEDYIKIRISRQKKKHWKKICSKKNISLTSLITDSVENRMLEDERRKVMTFIENQDNLFIRIENNINQVARMVNGQKYITENQLTGFQQQLQTIIRLKEQQNQIFQNIYSLIANDR